MTKSDIKMLEEGRFKKYKPVYNNLSMWFCD